MNRISDHILFGDGSHSSTQVFKIEKLHCEKQVKALIVEHFIWNHPLNWLNIALRPLVKLVQDPFADTQIVGLEWN